VLPPLRSFRFPGSARLPLRDSSRRGLPRRRFCHFFSVSLELFSLCRDYISRPTHDRSAALRQAGRTTPKGDIRRRDDLARLLFFSFLIFILFPHNLSASSPLSAAQTLLCKGCHGTLHAKGAAPLSTSRQVNQWYAPSHALRQGKSRSMRHRSTASLATTRTIARIVSKFLVYKDVFDFGVAGIAAVVCAGQ